MSSSLFDKIRRQIRDAGLKFDSMGQYFDFAANVLVVTVQINGWCKYPIQSFADVANESGGRKAGLFMGGRLMPFARLKPMFQDGFFPVNSEDDLLKKLVGIHQRQQASHAQSKGGQHAAH